MTIVIGFVSQKGGVGKSTAARGLAREAAANRWKVKVADLDTQQGTVVNWHRRRLEGDIKPVFSVESYKTTAQALEGGGDFDMLILDGPARTSKATLEIAQAANLLVQPTGASVDDLEPAVLVFHELKRAGIPLSKLWFALMRVGTEAEEDDCRVYIRDAGYNALKGCMFERPAYRQAQNQGCAVTETRFGSLNDRADQLIQSMIEAIGEP